MLLLIATPLWYIPPDKQTSFCQSFSNNCPPPLILAAIWTQDPQPNHLFSSLLFIDSTKAPLVRFRVILAPSPVCSIFAHPIVFWSIAGEQILLFTYRMDECATPRPVSPCALTSKQARLKVCYCGTTSHHVAARRRLRWRSSWSSSTNSWPERFTSIDGPDLGSGAGLELT